MKLLDYIRETPSGAATVANAAGIAPAFVYQIAHGRRRASPALARRIEDETSGAVTRRDLRPTDWGDIWPELIDDEHPWPGSARRLDAPEEVRDVA